MIVASKATKQTSSRSISSWILSSLIRLDQTCTDIPWTSKEIIEAAQKEKLSLHLYWLTVQSPKLQNIFESSEIFVLKQNYYAAVEKVTLQQEAIKELLDACEKALLPVILVRGQALGLFEYPDPALRPAWDVDIFIKAEDLSWLRNVCAQLGMEERKEHGEIGFYRSSKIPFHLDVHTELWYDSNAEAIWNRSVFKDFLGTPCRILSPEDHLIHLMAHSMAQHGRFSLHDGLDLALLIQNNTINWRHVLSMVQDTHLKILLTYAFESIRLQSELNLPAITLDPSEKRWLKFYQKIISSQDRPDIGHFLRPLLVKGIRSQLYFLWNFLFPDKKFIAQRYNVQNFISIFLWRVFRPIGLFIKGIHFLYQYASR